MVLICYLREPLPKPIAIEGRQFGSKLPRLLLDGHELGDLWQIRVSVLLQREAKPLYLSLGMFSSRSE